VFEAQVVDHDAVFVRPAIEVDVVGGFAFALHPRAHELQFPFDERLFVWRYAGIGQQGGEFCEVDAFGVGFFQDHGSGKSVLTNWQALIVRRALYALRMVGWQYFTFKRSRLGGASCSRIRTHFE
jgi:hypothetical protein